MKYTNKEEIIKAITETKSENVLFYNGKGSGFYNIDRMTQRYGNLPLHCKMYRDFETVGDGIYWLMQTCNCIKAEYSAKDIWERNMFKDHATTIKDNEEYIIVDITKAPETYEGVKVKAKINGDYSDAAVFIEI